MEVIGGQPGTDEMSPEIGHLFQSLVDTYCPPKTPASKQANEGNFAQVVTDDRVGSIFHQKPKCPRLESNQHDPKVTSPSS